MATSRSETARIGAGQRRLGSISAPGIGNVVGGRDAFENALECQLQLLPRNSLWAVGQPDFVSVPITLQVGFQQLHGRGFFLVERLQCAKLVLQLGDACLGMAQRGPALRAVPTRAGAIHSSEVNSRQKRCNGLPRLSAAFISTTKIRSRLRSSPVA